MVGDSSGGGHSSGNFFVFAVAVSEVANHVMDCQIVILEKVDVGFGVATVGEELTLFVIGVSEVDVLGRTNWVLIVERMLLSIFD